jgi:hypothetical protein
VIGTSPTTMRKLNLKLSPLPSWINEIDKILKFKRKFHTITVPQCDHNSTYATKKILERHGASLRHFKYSQASIEDFRDFFRHSPLLETLDIEKIVLKPQKMDKVKFPHLKHLKIHDCSDKILEQIDGATKLKSFSIKSMENREIILKFLMNHPTITSLTLGVGTIGKLFETDEILEIPQKLKALAFTAIRMRILPFEDRFKKFLKLQSALIEEFCCHLELTDESHDLIFTQFKNLNSLDLIVDFLPTEESFYCTMPIMIGLKKLKLNGKFANIKTANLFCSQFPKLVELDFKHNSMWFCKFLKKLAVYHPHLERLSINNLFKGTPPNLQFRSLKSFDVKIVEKFWKNFVISHRNLEIITIEHYGYDHQLTFADLESILDLPKLRKMIVTGPQVAKLEETFKEILKKDKNDQRIVDVFRSGEICVKVEIRRN